MSKIEAPRYPNLTFDEKSHIYRQDGIEVPSVTKIIEPLSRELYKGISDSVLQNAADRGTAVHSAIEFYLEYGIRDIRAEFGPYLDAFVDWASTKHPTVIGTEIRLYHSLLRYAGTCDLLCEIGGKLTLVDHKTTSAVNHKVCSVQLEAYAQALANAGIEVERKLILHLSKTGRWREHEYEPHDAESWRVFGACKTIFDYNKK